ncbi:MAG: hypothetical protein K8R59_13520, partial [Thermoanaerobaculales bacterium]|nr:hypothetical protein [Thermoanaerobaculales bacterium]
VYDEAARALRHLIKAHPDNLEGKLRLAVNLARTGADRPAYRLYRELIDLQSPDWIKVIAYQELARSLLAKGRASEAVGLLRQGTTRLPENQRLVIQLSFALDQAERRGEATEVLRGLSHANRGEDESPRYRYTEWPMLVQKAQNRYGGASSERALKSLAEGLARGKSGTGS